MSVELHIFTREFLGQAAVAGDFLRVLQELDLQPARMSSREPVREPYDRDGAVDLWCRYKQGSSQIAGGIMLKGEAPKYTFSLMWARGPAARPGYAYFLIADRDFRTCQDQFMYVLRQMFIQFDGLFAYVSEEKTANRQHVTGTLETRLPGMYWCTMLSDVYVDLFGGTDRVLKGPWHRAEPLQKGVVLYLSESPWDKDLTRTPRIETSAKEFLGADSFGDPVAFHSEPRVPQVKRVPKLDLPDIRVPLVEE